MKTFLRLTAAVLLLNTIIFLGTQLIAAPSAGANSEPTTWQEYVMEAVAQQTAIGFHPCAPTLDYLDASAVEGGIIADAGDTHTFGTCTIDWMYAMPGHPLPDPWDVPSVAWHEVCHLSTSPYITDHIHQYRPEDPYHKANIFQTCLHMGPAGSATYPRTRTNY